MQRIAVAVAVALALTLARAAAAEPIQLAVDLRDAPRRILHARETLPVAPGPLALRFAKWIPGEHAPSGPIADLAGLRIRAGKQVLAWERDPVDTWLIRVVVPAGATKLDVELDHLLPSDQGSFTAGPSSSARVAVLAWNTVTLYPDGVRASALSIEATLDLPAGWEGATALRIVEQRGAHVRYAPVSLETLFDSPVAAGAHYRAIPLAAPPGAPEHVLHLVADGEQAIQPKPEKLAPFQRLVPEALALFGAHHYGRYDFLLTLSDHVAHFGEEHHESSDDRSPERTFLDDSLALAESGLLPHELVHSWNGKYRRPAGLATGDYHSPMIGDLLWVYEGLTSYLGDVLTARSGLVTPEQARETFALEAAAQSSRKGREWRPLLDTARDAQHTYGARAEGTSWRRSTDFYDEGVMLWLEVDALIRTQTSGARSLDDFCRAFFGGESGPPQVKPYTRAELVAALAAVAPFDWDAFFRRRVDALRPGPPVEGIEAAGWKLVYTEAPNALSEAYAAASEGALDLRYSLGAYLSAEGNVLDVVPGLPIAAAGIAPGAQLVAVNGRAFTPDVLADAIRAAQATGELELLVRDADFFRSHALEYRGGVRSPHLVRDETRPDLLAQILAPRVRATEAPKPEATPEPAKPGATHESAKPGATPRP